mgnify:CR=1 FL=1
MTAVTVEELRAIYTADFTAFRAQSAAFKRGVDQDTRHVSRKFQLMSSSIIGSLGAVFAGAAVARFGASIVKTAGGFEASMKRVEGVLQTSGEEIDALSDKARQLGATTSFAASEAANAIETLAKNGLKAEDILGGALDASLSLAAALGGSLPASADLMTDVMQQFNLEADKLPDIADRITGAALNSKFSFDDFRNAMGQAGGVAGGDAPGACPQWRARFRTWFSAYYPAVVMCE